MRPHAMLFALLLCGACGQDEPVLSGVPEPQAPTSAPAAPGEEAPVLSELSQGAELPAAYQRAEGVLIDVRYLGGKTYQEVRDVVAEQLGPLQGSVELPAGAGTEMRFQRGELRVLDDRIIRVRVPLEPPLRRTAALAATGFPPATGRYVTLHREYRLHHEWGFRRIRLMREDRSSELVNAVDAWLVVPGESSSRR